MEPAYTIVIVGPVRWRCVIFTVALASVFICSCVCVYVCSENDVAAIDVNMGCPKEFSVKVQNFNFTVF